MKKMLLLSISLMLGTVLASAQATHNLAGHCPEYLADILQRSNNTDNLELRDFLTFGAGADCMTALLLTQYSGTDSFIDQIKLVKTALQQNGSSAGGGGATNLVSKGTTAQILSLATEYGALTQSTNGQTVTISGSLGGIPASLTRQAILSNCDGITLPGTVCVSDKTVNALTRLSYSVAFNTGSPSQSVSGTASSTNAGSAQPITFTGAGNSISSATGKFVLLRGAAASVNDLAKAVNALSPKTISTHPDQIKTARTAAKALFLNDDLPTMKQPKTGWRAVTAAKILAAGPDNAVTVWLQQAGALMAAICPSSGYDHDCRSKLLTELETYAIFANGYKADVNTFRETLRKAPLLTVEYDYNSPDSQPSNSTIRAIGQSLIGGWTFTGNAAISLYNSTPSAAIPGSGALRDIQVASEASFDFSKLKKTTLLSHSTASGAYYFQNQTSPAILNVTPGQPIAGITFTGLPSTAAQVYAKKGEINVAQAKFAYSAGSSGISVPIAVTWSNRTELVTNSTWRGQVGISYDLDSLFGSSK